MPALVKPLFRPEALRPKLALFRPTDAAMAARAKLAEWAMLLASAGGDKLKETEVLGDFFRDMLAYVGPAAGARVSL